MAPEKGNILPDRKNHEPLLSPEPSTAALLDWIQVLTGSQQRPSRITQPAQWCRREATAAGDPEQGQQTRQQNWPEWVSGPGPPSIWLPPTGLPYAALLPVGAGSWLDSPPASVPKCPLPIPLFDLSQLTTAHPNILHPFICLSSHLQHKPFTAFLLTFQLATVSLEDCAGESAV